MTPQPRTDHPSLPARTAAQQPASSADTASHGAVAAPSAAAAAEASSLQDSQAAGPICANCSTQVGCINVTYVP